MSMRLNRLVFFIIMGIIPLLLIPAFAQLNSQILPTNQGTLNVDFSTFPASPNPGDIVKLRIDFLNPTTFNIQEHIDYRLTVFKDGKTIFGPIPLTHTSTGSVTIPVELVTDGIYDAVIEVEGILFQPIPLEKVSFNIAVGDTDLKEQPTSNEIPNWIRNNAKWWSAGNIGDKDFVLGIQYLIDSKILNIPTTKQNTSSDSEEIPSWIKNNADWWSQGLISDVDFLKGIQYLVENGIIKVSTQNDSNIVTQSDQNISKSKQNVVTQIIDGDTIKVDGKSIRFALASAPELNESGGIAARSFIETICPVGSSVILDEDSGQPDGSYGRIIAVIHCNGMNLNAELLDSGLGYLSSNFCSTSEFANENWAQKHGCGVQSKPKIQSEVTPQANCDPSYPDVCIPPYPPDLDCGEIPYKNFRVTGSDPHRFDGDKDGIGCEK